MPLIDPNDPEMRQMLIESVPGLDVLMGADDAQRGLSAEEYYSEYEPVGTSNAEQGTPNVERVGASGGAGSAGAGVEYGDGRYGRARRVVDAFLPALQGLNEEERAQYSQYANRARRLAPIAPAQYGEVGSSRIAGNPHSIDTRGAAMGVRNLVSGIINKVRDKRRGEFMDDYEGLHNKQQSAAQRNQERDELMKKMGVEAWDAEQDRISDERSNKADLKKATTLESMRNTFRTNLENLKHENAMELQELENSGSTDFSPSIVTNFSNRAADTASQLFRQVNAIDEVLNSELNRPQDPEKLAELEDERERKNRLGFEFMQLGGKAATGGLNRDLQQRADSLYSKAINLNEGDNTEGGGGSDSANYTEEDVKAYADTYGLSMEQARKAFNEDFN